MVLAKERRAVAALAQNFRHHGFAFGNLPAVAGIPAPYFRDDPRPCGVVIAACQQRRSRGRTERGGMEAGVAQSRLRQAVEIGRRNLPAKRTPVAEAGIVNHDEQHIGGTRGRLDERDFIRRRILVRLADDALEFGFGPRQDVLREHRSSRHRR